MEGLLPMIYKAIKKNKTRRKYECLSSGDAISYNINMAEMIYAHGYQNPSTNNVAGDYEEKIGHRRCKSVGDFSSGFSSFPRQIDFSNGFSSSRRRTFVDASSSSKQLVRFRSRKILSCITGV